MNPVLSLLDPNKSDYFVYQGTFTAAVGGGATAGKFSVDVPTDRDSVFFWCYGQVFCADATNNTQNFSAAYAADALLNLRDASTGRNLTAAPMILPAFFGTGVFPVQLPKPYAFAPASVIECDLQILSGNVPTFDIQLAFIGIKIFEN
jgi:hypothetical protein